MKLIFLSLLLLIIPFSESFYAKVVEIHDGDSITVLTPAHEQIKVRLEGIDCPELKQDFGQKSKQLTAALCFNQEVRIVKTGKDQYGRTLAFVYVGDLCINYELLKQGLAWHYKKYNHNTELAELESNARSKKSGLWSLPAPVAPWAFRKKK
jgi:endonuclease YncB( thermonuclease family)